MLRYKCPGVLVIFLEDIPGYNISRIHDMNDIFRTLCAAISAECLWSEQVLRVLQHAGPPHHIGIRQGDVHLEIGIILIELPLPPI